MKTATLIACLAKQVLAAASGAARIIYVNIVIFAVDGLFNEGFAYLNLILEGV
jgi:hypothetical protein